MRPARGTGGALLLAAFGLVVAGAPAATARPGPPPLPGGSVAKAHEVLQPGDGWGSDGTGTTGGTTATTVQVVTNRAELAAAVAGDAPKIVVLRGHVEGNTDDAGAPLTCDDYAAGTGYTLAGYLAAYDPAVWGRTTKPSGPLETARLAAAANQKARVMIPVGANTTLIGIGDARITGANLTLTSVDNVIIRNITFTDAADCFPVWDPTDGAEGNWNSLYDNVSLIGATHVWLDHNTFTDRPNLDSGQPLYLGRPYQVHDGSSDITKASDLVTVSWNRYVDHDKTMLIGSTNSPTYDVGKLRVTVHHNVFDTVLQRAPRVRYGQVDVYDNYYRIPAGAGYQYSWGVGVQSAIVAEHNFFRLEAGVDSVNASSVIYDWGGTAITTGDNVVAAGRERPVVTDLLAAHNAVTDPDLSGDAGWTPVLRRDVDPAARVPSIVPAQAGVGHLLSHG